MSRLEPPSYRKVSSYAYPSFSEKEFETRHKRIRKWMEGKGLDCLIVSGGGAAFGVVEASTPMMRSQGLFHKPPCLIMDHDPHNRDWILVHVDLRL